MNNYYAIIAGMLGYPVINPNQAVPFLIDTNKNSDYLEISSIGDRYFYKNTKGETVLEINTYHKTMVFTIKGMKIEIPNNPENNCIYNVKLSGGKKEISIKVFLEKITSTDHEIGSIEVSKWDKKNPKEIEGICSIKQFVGNQRITYFNGGGSWSYPAKECTARKDIDFILKFLNSDEEIAKSIVTQESIKIVVPSLTRAINDLLKYWKNYAIDKERKIRESNIANYEDQINALRDQIEQESNAIDTLDFLSDMLLGKKKK